MECARSRHKLNTKEWKVDSKVAGETRRAGGLTFATIEGAGHVVGVVVSTLGDGILLTRKFLVYHQDPV